MDIEKKLSSVNNEEYGDSYNPHLLEIYKAYVEMADRVSTRRQSANSFFLSINTALVALTGYVQLGQKTGQGTDFYWIVSLAGMALCYTWYRLIKSYKDLNSGKFKVIHEMERRLPISPYDAEWEALGRGKDAKLYLPFTKVEMAVPWIFFSLHFVVLLRVVL
jgi:hypothetical protein